MAAANMAEINIPIVSLGVTSPRVAALNALRRLNKAFFQSNLLTSLVVETVYEM